MSFKRTIGLRWLRGKHWFHRHWVATCYAIRLHHELRTARRRLTRKFGGEWVRTRLPDLTHARLTDSAWGLLRLAADPNIDREHRRRTARWKACLRKLRDLQPVAYALTDPASQRVYHAALRRCLSGLAGEPVYVPDWAGPNRGSLTLAILRWLESVGLDQDPVVLAMPLASSAFDPLGAVSRPVPRAQTTAAVASEDHWVAAVRRQYEFVHEGNLGELHAAYLRCYLAHVALAEALAVTSETAQA